MKQLQSHFPPGEVCAVDNHLLLDPVFALYNNREPAHYDLRWALRRVFFTYRPGSSVAVLRQHVDIVRGTSIPLYWITLQCDRETVERRATSTERLQWAKTKLTDLPTPRNVVDELDMIDPIEDGGPPDDTEIIAATVDANGTAEVTCEMILGIITGAR
ncbi:hypothetical protein F4780DRAFT_778286 [Xylariomycetidae sp. FL0641]|nr:hypothetical protein F4780DRAFT_778286 [Xylariomycetidae sp. FL0641]